MTRTRKLAITLLAVLAAFGLGAGWQYREALDARRQLMVADAERETLRRDLALEQLESSLALATIAAQLGNFERSRQIASEFYSALQQRLAGAPEAGRPVLQEILAGRDDIITQLSRSQPESGLELARALVRYRQAMGRAAAGLGPAMTSPPDTMR